MTASVTTTVATALLSSCCLIATVRAQVSVDVYDVGLPSVSGGVWAGASHTAFDDVTFGGPASRGPILLTEVRLGVVVPVNASLGQQTYARVSIYPGYMVTTPPTWPSVGDPIVATIALGDLSQSAGFHTERTFPFPSQILLDQTNVFDSDADRTVGVKIELFFDAALTQPADGWQVIRRANMPWANGRHSFPVGSSAIEGAWISNTPPVPFSTPFNRPLYLVLTATYTCSTADFNGDGNAGADADLEAFFACLAGDCCSSCFPLGADFNADGDSGTDADIESFFRVLAGGAC